MGKTILISSHILSELADFCTSIGIIERGKLLAAGSIQEIQQQIRVAPGAQGPAARRAAPTGPRACCATTPRSGWSRLTTTRVTAEFEGEDQDMARLLGRLVRRGSWSSRSPRSRCRSKRSS